MAEKDDGRMIGHNLLDAHARQGEGERRGKKCAPSFKEPVPLVGFRDFFFFFLLNEQPHRRARLVIH